MDADTLTRQLRRIGVRPLAVAGHRRLPDVLTVHLPGHTGQHVDGWALRRIATLTGVIDVTESVRTPTILLVWVDTLDEQERPSTHQSGPQQEHQPWEAVV